MLDQELPSKYHSDQRQTGTDADGIPQYTDDSHTDHYSEFEPHAFGVAEARTGSGDEMTDKGTEVEQQHSAAVKERSKAAEKLERGQEAASRTDSPGQAIMISGAVVAALGGVTLLAAKLT